MPYICNTADEYSFEAIKKPKVATFGFWVDFFNPLFLIDGNNNFYWANWNLIFLTLLFETATKISTSS